MKNFFIHNDGLQGGWNILCDAVAIYLQGKGYKSPDSRYFEGHGQSFFILPLEELELLPDYRLKDWASPVIFLYRGKRFVPSRKNPSFPYLKELFGNPEFGHTAQAIFRAEIVWQRSATDTDEALPGNREPLNVADVLAENFLMQLDCVIARLHDKQERQNGLNLELMGRYREMYYQSFVAYYDVLPDSEKPKIKDVDRLLLQLRFGKQQLTPEEGHRVDMEFIRAPLSFYLQHLAEVANFIANNIKENKRIRLLLLDNQAAVTGDDAQKNKFIQPLDTNSTRFEAANSKPGPLCALLLDKEKCGDLASCFEISMLGGENMCSSSEGVPKFSEEDFKPDNESFKAERFFSTIRSEKNEYPENVYEQITKADFILLDFFLDKDNTYLAFDLINKISELKLYNNNSSTLWYFITSAVHDSVASYAQSGLLAQFYESAVVNSGDDPTNPKRQIIFLYKLLTFINSRAANFRALEKSVLKNKLFTCRGIEYSCSECLHKLTSMPRKYLAEFSEIKEIFPKLADEKTKKIAELIIQVVDQYSWLPEADWPMIQMQINYLVQARSEVKDSADDGKEVRFYCKYIQDELNRRAEVY